MKVHEYQAKSILARYGVAVPRGEVTSSPAEAREIAKRLGGRVVVKAQIHAGGRGKGGGVKLAGDPEEAHDVAEKILGMTLVTPQTGPAGRIVQKVLVEEAPRHRPRAVPRRHPRPVSRRPGGHGLAVRRAWRSRRSPQKDPDAIVREPVDPLAGLFPFQAPQARLRARALRREPSARPCALVQALMQAYVETDASLAEVNPLLVTKQGDVLALDAKMNFDDNALFRHPDIKEMRDLSEEDPLEVEASRFGLNYIKLDGNIGCMVNGAGLAMATMDLVKLAGGEPANFLDVGGGRQRGAGARTRSASSSRTRTCAAILINIFGGIMRCDIIAKGVVAAVREMGLAIPLVVRLEGTNVDLGKQILRESRPEDHAGRRPARTRRRRSSRRPRGRDEHLVGRRRASSSRASPAREGTFHALGCREYGTQVVAGVTPGKGGNDARRHPGLRHGRRRRARDRRRTPR